MLSIIGHASPSFVTFISKTTTTGFAKEATDTPELSEESWIAFSRPQSPCSEMLPFTIRRDAQPKNGTSNDSCPRTFLLTQAWGVHAACPNRRQDFIGAEAGSGREGHAWLLIMYGASQKQTTAMELKNKNSSREEGKHAIGTVRRARPQLVRGFWPGVRWRRSSDARGARPDFVLLNGLLETVIDPSIRNARGLTAVEP